MRTIKALKNLKHIFVVSLISVFLIFGIQISFSDAFRDAIQNYLVVRTQTQVGAKSLWQDVLYKPKTTASDNIALIKIDDQTINDLQAKTGMNMLGIPKTTYTELVQSLEKIGVRGIAFDILFQNTDADEDTFATTLEQAGNVVIAVEEKGNAFTQETATCSANDTCEGLPKAIYAGVPWGNIIIQTSSSLEKTQEIAMPMTVPLNKGIPESLRQNLLQRNLSVKPLSVVLYELTNTNSLLPADVSKIIVPFFQDSTKYLSINLSTFLKHPNAYSEKLKRRYVFIGVSGNSFHDQIVSPLSGEIIDGVEVHANLLDGILQNKLLAHVSGTIQYLLVILLSTLMALCYLLLPKKITPFIAILFIIGTVVIARYMYDGPRLILDVFPLILAAGVITLPTTFSYKYFVVDREKRELQSNFGHYIDPEVVREIAERDEPIELGGEKRELSVLFSDIAGFTTLSEKLVPQDLFYLMTSYLSNMTDILIREGGTLDKYIGDAVMGFFGAPLPHADHAVRACRTALLMREQLPAFNADITAHGMDPVDFRVGIATGEVMVGNIGSHDRFNYTVLGDTVNLASRLEGTGKEYDVHIIISESVRDQIGPDFSVRELDTIAVKGKTEGVRIYELIGFVAKVSDRTIYDNYEQALALYRAGNYQEAGKIWYSQMETDPPSRIMALRCASVIKGEIIVENGIYRMTHK